MGDRINVQLQDTSRAYQRCQYTVIDVRPNGAVRAAGEGAVALMPARRSMITEMYPFNLFEARGVAGGTRITGIDTAAPRADQTTMAMIEGLTVNTGARSGRIRATQILDRQPVVGDKEAIRQVVKEELAIIFMDYFGAPPPKPNPLAPRRLNIEGGIPDNGNNPDQGQPN
jgi:hypothetical protein